MSANDMKAVHELVIFFSYSAFLYEICSSPKHDYKSFVSRYHSAALTLISARS